MDFRFDSHPGSRRVPASHIVCSASTPPTFASAGIRAGSSSRRSALITGFDSKTAKKKLRCKTKNPPPLQGILYSHHGSRTRLSALRGRRTKPIFEAAKPKQARKKELTFEPALVPQGGFEPPRSEPESEVLPLHNRGMHRVAM